MVSGAGGLSMFLRILCVARTNTAVSAGPIVSLLNWMEAHGAAVTAAVGFMDTGGVRGARSRTRIPDHSLLASIPKELLLCDSDISRVMAPRAEVAANRYD